MGYQNKRHAAKLFQTESFFIDSANSLERDVFDCLCDMTPVPQSRPPYRDVPIHSTAPVHAMTSCLFLPAAISVTRHG